MMQAIDRLVDFAGGAWNASLNLYTTGRNRKVVTHQIDEWVYAVCQDSVNITRFSLNEWIGEAELADPPFFDCDDERMAWELLTTLREDCLLWQCGACDSWIFARNRPRVGRLQCSTCRDGGVDFRHADRHVGGDEE